jgi:hypothetical protein
MGCCMFQWGFTSWDCYCCHHEEASLVEGSGHSDKNSTITHSHTVLLNSEKYCSRKAVASAVSADNKAVDESVAFFSVTEYRMDVLKKCSVANSMLITALLSEKVAKDAIRIHMLLILKKRTL